ncbi:MAG: EutN/CcmL family microcompartment protein [Chloroflexi bacterium]|nr:EutN/CcmL family microcompartment protein [Chloroflexota bacterium]MBI3740317.1 EutN/CcmL family microcompartment protein [Chloroflexota bacterium]
MIIGKVIGTIVSSVKHPTYNGWKILLVQPLHLPGEPADDAFIAVDAARAGVGDTVLICQEGNSTRQVLGDPNAPVRSSIVGVIDSVNLNS